MEFFFSVSSREPVRRCGRRQVGLGVLYAAAKHARGVPLSPRRGWRHAGYRRLHCVVVRSLPGNRSNLRAARGRVPGGHLLQGGCGREPRDRGRVRCPGDADLQGVPRRARGAPLHPRKCWMCPVYPLLSAAPMYVCTPCRSALSRAPTRPRCARSCSSTPPPPASTRPRATLRSRTCCGATRRPPRGRR